MNKKKFLKILEEKLQILNEEERTDILNEYRDTIEEKIKHGSSEEDAVADFGDIDELSKEILKAYKINPDYNKNTSKEKAKEFVEQGESFVKRSAAKMSDWTKDIIDDFKNNNQDWNLEKVFEVIIKAILLLIGLAFLRIPFFIIEGLGGSIFSIALYPIDAVLTGIWKIFVGLVYFLVCILITMIIFKPYFMKETKKKNSKKKEVTESKEEKNSKSIISEMIKFFLFLVFVLPLYLIDFGCYIIIAFIIFFIIQGVPLLGLFLFILAITILFSFLSELCYNLLYGKKKVHVYSLVVSAILLVVGGLLFIHTILNFNYNQGLPQNTLNKKEHIYKEEIGNKTFIVSSHDYQKEVNNTLKDGEVEIVVSYYPEIVEEIEHRIIKKNDNIYMSIRVDDYEVNKKNKKEIYDMIIKELNNHSIYEYHKLMTLDIKVRANEHTLTQIK